MVPAAGHYGFKAASWFTKLDNSINHTAQRPRRLFRRVIFYTLSIITRARPDHNMLGIDTPCTRRR